VGWGPGVPWGSPCPEQKVPWTARGLFARLPLFPESARDSPAGGWASPPAAGDPLLPPQTPLGAVGLTPARASQTPLHGQPPSPRFFGSSFGAHHRTPPPGNGSLHFCLVILARLAAPGLPEHTVPAARVASPPGVCSPVPTSSPPEPATPLVSTLVTGNPPGSVWGEVAHRRGAARAVGQEGWPRSSPTAAPCCPRTPFPSPSPPREMQGGTWGEASDPGVSRALTE